LIGAQKRRRRNDRCDVHVRRQSRQPDLRSRGAAGGLRSGQHPDDNGWLVSRAAAFRRGLRVARMDRKCPSAPIHISHPPFCSMLCKTAQPFRYIPDHFARGTEAKRGEGESHGGCGPLYCGMAESKAISNITWRDSDRTIESEMSWQRDEYLYRVAL
jgi:hypothetical protein